MDFRPQLHPEYALAVILAVLVALAFPITRDLPDARTRRQYWKLQALVVIAAVIGAKLAVLFGEFGWPFRPVGGDWAAVLVSGRSSSAHCCSAWSPANSASRYSATRGRRTTGSPRCCRSASRSAGSAAC
jgi:hypothetical protein